MISRCFAREIEHVHFGRAVRVQLIETFHDLGITVQDHPTAMRNFAEPLSVGCT